MIQEKLIHCRPMLLFYPQKIMREFLFPAYERIKKGNIYLKFVKILFHSTQFSLVLHFI